MQSTNDKIADVNQLNAADKSLSDALRVSFITLTVIMIGLVIFFLLFGSIRTVESGEEALVLRLGKIRGIGEKRLLKPGLHLALPYPIDEVVRIPVSRKVNISVNTFWYLDRNRPPAALNPVYDGYCITRGQEQGQNAAGFGGNDYNIVHSKWQLTYQIDDAERFFKNVYIADVKPGQSYADVIAESVKPLLENLVADSIVRAMVNYTIDEAISNQYRITEHVERLLQEKLRKIESGIEVASVQLTNIIWPQQVNSVFLDSIKASQASQQTINEARSYAENTLNETAGPVSEELLAVLEGKKSVSEEEEEFLWSQLAGAAQEIITQAQAYRRKVVDTTKANAEYLQKILPEYKKRPELVIQEIWQSAIEEVLDNADEKMIIQSTAGTKEREMRIILNRDPAMKKKSAE